MGKVSTRKRNKNYYYSYEGLPVNGKRHRVEHGEGYKTRKEAELAGIEALNNQNHGAFIITTDTTLSEFLEMWFESAAPIIYKETSLITRKVVISRRVNPYIGGYRLTALNPMIISKWLLDLKADGYRKGTISVTKGLLSNALDYAVLNRHIYANPCKTVRIPKMEEDRKRIIPLSREEWEELMSYIPPTSHYYIAFNLGYHTGMREGEVCGLRWGDVDFKNNVIHVRNQLTEKLDGTPELTRPKYGSERDITMGSTIRKVLLQARAMQGAISPKDYVFNKNGTPVRRNVLANYTRHQGINFHLFRHTHATMLAEAGWEPKLLQDRLGHKDITTTLNYYVHVTDKMKENQVSKLDKILL